jgi:hypothetical protein
LSGTSGCYIGFAFSPTSAGASYATFPVTASDAAGHVYTVTLSAEGTGVAISYNSTTQQTTTASNGQLVCGAVYGAPAQWVAKAETSVSDNLPNGPSIIGVGLTAYDSFVNYASQLSGGYTYYYVGQIPYAYSYVSSNNTVYYDIQSTAEMAINGGPTATQEYTRPQNAAYGGANSTYDPVARQAPSFRSGKESAGFRAFVHARV